jgi:hypothetical protein
MSSGVVAAFSPNDFFYVKAQNGLLDRPMPAVCPGSNVNRDTCDIKPTAACVDAELCKNQTNSDTLYSIQNEHGGSDQRFADSKTVYNEALLNNFNLGIGIIIMTGFIYTKYIYSKTSA